ncbi:Uncharacterized membrane protein [Halopseudomonas xinjiangensis]|uniref:Uncharacterized membrane protein n=2 Tax=Halopseudomonas xinjiangensis TaxID=487184 RepID=A0A1H1VF39_9GAMM|nr:Uncharacterized membrane protein [Halopseudomonas xinjiangensis]
MIRGQVKSRVVVLGHPIHPMLIHFPVAAMIAVLGTDLAYVFTLDEFWARASVWLAGTGAVGGLIAGSIGMIDLVTVPEIRRLVTSWCHAIMAVTLLSLATLNWLLRIVEPSPDVLPWGVYLSLLNAVLISITSMLGGQLVYDHAIGVSQEKVEERRQQS